MQELPISFERGLYQAVIRFKQSHPGVLEDRTRERKEKEWKEQAAHRRPNGSVVRNGKPVGR